MSRIRLSQLLTPRAITSLSLLVVLGAAACGHESPFASGKTNSSAPPHDADGDVGAIGGDTPRAPETRQRVVAEFEPNNAVIMTYSFFVLMGGLSTDLVGAILDAGADVVMLAPKNFSIDDDAGLEAIVGGWIGSTVDAYLEAFDNREYDAVVLKDIAIDYLLRPLVGPDGAAALTAAEQAIDGGDRRQMKVALDELTARAARHVIALLRDLARNPSFHVLNLSHTYPPAEGEDPLGFWARDFGPLVARDGDGRLFALDLEYGGDVDETLPHDYVDAINARAASAGGNVLTHVPVEIGLDGGDFMINTRGDCMTTDFPSFSEHYGDLLRQAAGCENLIVFPDMPHSYPDHIDFWAKFVDDDTVFVSQITDEQIALAATVGESYAEDVREMQAYLSARKADLERLGFDVVTLPLPLPSYEVIEEWGIEINVLLSYINTLLLNDGVRKTAIYPKHTAEFWDGRDPQQNVPDRHLFARYEEQVARAFQEAGYRPVGVVADHSIPGQGSIHCLTMQTVLPEGLL